MNGQILYPVIFVGPESGCVLTEAGGTFSVKLLVVSVGSRAGGADVGVDVGFMFNVKADGIFEVPMLVCRKAGVE